MIHLGHAEGRRGETRTPAAAPRPACKLQHQAARMQLLTLRTDRLIRRTSAWSLGGRGLDCENWTPHHPPLATQHQQLIL